jgi:hypothetical protein
MTDALAGALLYLGLIGMALGAVSLLVPLRFLGIRTRKKGGVVLLLGLTGFIAGVYFPIDTTYVRGVGKRLDELIPVFQFSESHQIVVEASRSRVYEAIRDVRPGEIRFFNTLMTIRFLQAPREDRPILESFTSGWFRLLADDPGREIVFGRAAHAGKQLPPEQFAAAHAAPLIKIAMNFHIREIDSTHCLVSTDTRVYAVGRDMLRGFAAYWRIIRPGSALIRRMWLRAIKRRAEAYGSAPSTSAERPLSLPPRSNAVTA